MNGDSKLLRMKGLNFLMGLLMNISKLMSCYLCTINDSFLNIETFQGIALRVIKHVTLVKKTLHIKIWKMEER